MFLSVFFLRNSLQFKKVSLPLQPHVSSYAMNDIPGVYPIKSC